MTIASRALLGVVLLCGLAPYAVAQTRPPPALANATIEDHTRCGTNLEELPGAPHNPRRVSVGLSLRVR